MRQVPPNTVSYATWWDQPGAGGNCRMAQLMNEAKPRAAKPAQTTLRARAYPYTSVRMSPKT